MGICFYSICGVLCFNRAQSKSLEITLIVLNSISVFLLLLTLAMVKWKNISIANVIFFILMFLICICCLLFSILIRLWRSKDLIKTIKKATGISLSTAGLTLTIINFVLCLIEEIIITIGFSRADYPCRTYSYYENPYYRRTSSDIDCSGRYSNYYTGIISTSEYLITYFTLSYLEISLILNMIIWSILKGRIRLELDGPAQAQPVIHSPSPQVYDPYGRAVIVVQPGDVVMMGGNQYQYNPYAQNPPISIQPNPEYPASNDHPIDEKIS